MHLNFQDEGSGIPVVILHGLFGSLSNWKGIARKLAVSCRVITVDLRNHGRSGWDNDVSYQAMAKDLSELLDDLALDQAMIVGHSMGGKVAMTLALSQPARVSGLVVVDIAPVEYGHSHSQLIDTLLKVDLTKILKRQDLDRQLSLDIPEPGLRMFLSQNLIFRDGRYQWRVNLHALAEGMNDLTGFPPLNSRQYHGDSVFIFGQASDYVLPEHEEEIRKLFPNSELLGVPNAGHWLHAEQPGRIVDVVSDLLVLFQSD